MYKTVLCIDPSSKCSGIAVIEDGAVVYTTTASGLCGNYKAIEELIIQYKPQLLLKESPFCGINKKTYSKLCKIHGVIELLAELHNIPIKEYTPSQGKKNCGTSTKDKNSKKIVNSYVNNYFGTNITNLDVTDALVLYINYVKEGGNDG